jgi:hypothetical protein
MHSPGERERRDTGEDDSTPPARHAPTGKLDTIDHPATPDHSIGRTRADPSHPAPASALLATAPRPGPAPAPAPPRRPASADAPLPPLHVTRTDGGKGVGGRQVATRLV